MKSQTNNIYDLFLKTAKINADRVALVEQGTNSKSEITFERLESLASSCSAGFIAKGLKEGDKVVVMIPMSIDLYVTLLALFKIGAVGVFVDPWMPMSQIAKFSAFAKPKGFIGIFKSHILRAFNKSLWTLPLSVTTGFRLFNLPAKVSLNELKAYLADSEVCPVEVDCPALITFTSGSSGTPKGANRTHEFLKAQHHALQHEFPYSDRDVDLTMFPVFALNNLARGITTIIPNINFKEVKNANPEKLVKDIEAHLVSTITASPPLIDNLANYVLCNSLKLSIKRMLVGGAPVSDKQLQFWRNAFPDTEILVVYGSTEAEPTAHIALQERLAIASSVGKGVCMGHVSSLCKAIIIPLSPELDLGQDVDLDSIKLKKGEIGELIVSGPHVCRDYYMNEQAVRENKIRAQDGTVWHRMGDTGYFDDSGNFWLCGRVHSSIRRGDQIYHAQIVEQIVYSVDEQVKAVAALGIRNKNMGEALCVVIQADLEEAGIPIMKQKVRDILRSFSIEVDGVLIRTEAFPVDARHNSKIQYGKLKEEIVGYEQ